MISASDILQSLGLRHRATELRALDTLDPQDRARVERAIAALPANATVNVTRLAEQVRRERGEADTRAEIARLLRDRGDWRTWLLHIATDDEAQQFRGRVKSGAAPEAAMHAMLGPPSLTIAAPAPKAETTPRRRIPRLRALARGQTEPNLQPEAQEAKAAPLLEQTEQPKRTPVLAVFGKAWGTGVDSRPYGCPTDADYSRWRDAGRKETEC